MPEIIIANMYRVGPPRQAWDFRVDRQNILGNPYPMRDASEREPCCDQYELWFRRRLEGTDEWSVMVRDELVYLRELYARYGRVTLMCWCAPKRCHAETIRDYLLWWERQNPEAFPEK